MWQPPLNKKLHEDSVSYTGNKQQDEFATNLLHMQKLQLTDLLPPLTSTAHHPLYSNGTNTTSTQINPHDGQSTTIYAPWATASNNNNRRHLLIPATSPTADTVTPTSTAFLPPPPVPALLPDAQMPTASSVLDLLPLHVITDTFTRLSAFHLALNSVSGTTVGTSNRYFQRNGRTILPTSPPSLPLSASCLPANTTLYSPQHLNLFKQYLLMEQQLHQNLLALNDFNKTSANTLSKPTWSTSNGYYSASINNLSASTLNTAALKSTCCCFNCDQQQRFLRKRRDDLNYLFKNSNNSTSTPGLNGGEKDDLLPPPKKKWIRHYLKANNHQLHVQNGNNNNANNNNNNNNCMVVDEIPPTSHQHHTTSSLHSPPRYVSSSLGAVAGSHYMHMINAASSQQTGSATNHMSTPRRRTISSTSNGAGTREVHNKLEKNRRAHLKECYEALKNQLSLKDEDRRKTSNLAILGEALKCVQSFQKRNQELEAEWEHLANDKINLQKRIVSLKRELGPKYEQIFSGIFPEIEIGSIPSEREAINETHSLSSGRGSTLYSSSSSLSSGGSNASSISSGGSGSNTMSSPVGAGLQTAMPTTISPVINKINNNINSTSPISINSNSNVVIQQQHQHQRKTPSITTTIQAVAIPAHAGSGSGGLNSPPAGSPTALVTFGSSLPLSLTAKNISATAVTRGSPTPSTPSPSPSSSSGVSSSSSLISSSPPINGVINNNNNGRNVTVNIPNGLKLQAATVAAGAGLNGAIVGNGTTSTTAATMLSTSAPAQGVNNTNNVSGNQLSQQQQQHHGRKKNLTLSNNNNSSHNNNINNNKNNNNIVESKNNYQQQQQQQHANEDGEQPAKFLKVFNSSKTLTNGHHQQHEFKAHGQKFLLTSNGGILQGGGSGGGGVGCGDNTNTAKNNASSITAAAAAINKSVTVNGGSSSAYAATPATITTVNELCRLPGGAELNILPSNGLKISSAGVGPVATAFYHANGKITFVNGPPGHHHPHQYQYQQHPPSSPLPNSTTITSNGSTTLTNGILLKDATSVTPLLVSSASSPAASSVNGLHFAGNFAQLLAANTTATANAIGHINNGTLNTTAATASIVPMATNYQNIVESKTKNNSKAPVVAWRSGAAAN